MDYQWIDQLLSMDSMGTRKPSELLTHILELCPTGKETSKFFTFHFLHPLPQVLHIMLGDDNPPGSTGVGEESGLPVGDSQAQAAWRNGRRGDARRQLNNSECHQGQPQQQHKGQKGSVPLQGWGRTLGHAVRNVYIQL